MYSCLQSNIQARTQYVPLLCWSVCRKLLVCGPAFPVLNPCAFEGGSAWIPDVGVEPGCPWLRTTYNALSAFLPLLSSPPSNSHISRVRSAPDWPPRMPLNGGGLGKHFKRKPKSVSHLPPPLSRPSLLSLFLSHTHTAVIWLFKFSAAFLQLELVYDIPSADSLASRSLSPLSLSLALALSDAHTQIQHNLIFSCSVLSLPSASNVSCSSHSPADAVDVCCTTWYVWRQRRNKVAHTPCVSSLWGGVG